MKVFSVVKPNNLAWSVIMTCYARSVPMTTAWIYLGFFLVASHVFHAIGCVINDMWDKDIDAAICGFPSFSYSSTPCDTFT
jgi:4-hydroxybenzoate polyprenyltransferase